MNWQFFDKYLEENGNFGECISNHKNKILVYKENVEGTNFYIKKYIPYGKRKIRIAFGIYDDRAIHYEKVVKYLEKLDLPYVKLEYKKIKRISPSCSSAKVFMPACGTTSKKASNGRCKKRRTAQHVVNIIILRENRRYGYTRIRKH